VNVIGNVVGVAEIYGGELYYQVNNKIAQTKQRIPTSSTSYSTIYNLYFICSLLTAMLRSETGLLTKGHVL